MISKIAKLNQNIVLFIFVQLFALLAFYLLNRHIPMISDDYDYSFIFHTRSRLGSLLDIINSQYRYYTLWGGRVVPQALSQLFLFIGRPVFQVINSIAGILLVNIIYVITVGLENRKLVINNFLSVVLYILIWLGMPVFAQIALWLNGSCNYLWSFIFIFSCLLFYRLTFDNVEKDGNILKAVAIFFIGLLAGNCSENVSFTMIALISVFILINIICKRKSQLWVYAGFAGSVIGFALLVLAPGNFVRISSSASVSLITRINMLIRNSESQIFHIVLLLVLFGVLYMQYKGKIPVKRIMLSIVSVLAAILSMIIMLASPQFPLRATAGCSLFLIIAIINLLKVVLESFQVNLEVRIKQYCLVFVTIAILYSGLTYYKVLTATISRYHHVENWKEIVEQSKRQGQRDVTVPVLVPSKDTRIFNFNLNPDPKKWPNTIIAVYYDIDSIQSKN